VITGTGQFSPGAIAFSSSSYSVNEEGTAVHAITLTRINGSDGIVTVTVTPSNGTATQPSDYNGTPIVVFFDNGQISKTVVVPIVDDTQLEVIETVNLTLSNPTGGATLGTQQTATLNIIDNDALPGKIQFSNANYSVNENGTPVTAVTLTRTNGSDGEVSATISLTNSTATAGSDYNNSPITVNFANGETSKTVTIPIVNDTQFEPDETINLTLTNPQGGATLGTQTTATLTIINDDLPKRGTISLNSSTYTVNENGTFSVDLTRIGGSDGEVSVTLTPTDGTATAGSDYNNSPITVTFANGETNKNFTIPIIDDNVYEPTETVNLALSNPTGGATLGTQKTAVLNIIDNDAVPGVIQFSNANYSVNEDGTPVTAVTLTRTNGSDGEVSATISLTNGTATAGSDYSNSPITVNFANGETSKTVTIPIVNDTQFEPDETINLTLTNPQGGATLGTQTTATLTIINDDLPKRGTISLNSSTYTVNENGTFSVDLTRIGGSDGEVSVTLTPTDGTATAGSDYNNSPITVTFANGETNKNFTIPIIDDNVYEPTETVNLALSNPTGGATLGTQKTATLNIIDNDALPGKIQFSNANYSVNENGTPVTAATLTRTNGSDGEVSATISLTNGTATAGSDYNNSPITVNFANGETSKTVTIPIVNDVNEDGTPVTAVTLIRTNGSDGEVSVSINLTNGTANAGSDYNNTPITVNFANGETSKTVTIPIIDDAIFDPNQTINLTLSNPTNGSIIGNQNISILTIIDNDIPRLSLVLNQDNIYEGETATGIITRNTEDQSSELVIILASSDTKEAIVPETVTIPVNQDSATFSLTGVNDGTFDANQNVTITASKTGFNSGIDTIVIKNADLPDLAVSNIVAPINAQSEQAIDITWTLTNQGNVTASGSWVDYIYLSDDAKIGNDKFLGAFTFDGAIAPGASVNRTQSITLPLILSGNQRIIVSTDASNQIPERLGTETNNTTIDDIPIAVSLKPLPNLQVSSVVAPPTAFSSQSTAIQWTVTNAGNAATSSPYWNDEVYLSLDNTFDNTDIYLGQATNPSYLNAGDSYTNSLNVTLPRGVSGNYSFLVKTDVNNNVYNFGSGGPTNVSLTLPPDFQVTTVTTPSQAFSGQPLNLSWTVTNKGQGKNLETSWYDQVFMSADEVLDGSDRNLGTFYRSGTLNNDENYTTSQTVTLPIGVSGDYFFFVRTDAGNQVYENAFDGNNTGYKAIATRINLTPPPDLEFDFVDAPSQATSSRPLNFAYQITNYGATSTPNNSWTDTFYLSLDNQLDADTDLKIGSQTHYGSLASNGSYTSNFSYTLSNTITGNYYLFAVTDSSNQVFELNKINNTAFDATPITITSKPPDLVVSSATVPTTTESNQQIRVDWTVTNQGTGDTVVNNWKDQVIFSADSQIGNSDDISLGSFNRNELLNSNGFYSRSELVIIPIQAIGQYQVFVITDTSDSVYEALNENNNVSAGQALTVTRLTPDLQVTKVTTPIIANSGKAIRVAWTVTNLDTGSTAVTKWTDKVILSTDNQIGNSDDILLGSFDRNELLNANDSYNRSELVTLPITTGGQYQLFVVTDANENVYEANKENNNVSTSQFLTISQQSPDLQVTQVIAPTTAESGQSLTINWTVQNFGTNPTNSNYWYEKVYLSTDKQISSDDVVLGSVYRSGAIEPSGQYTVSRSFNLPINLQGSYYTLVQTDSENNVFEGSLENNNNGSTSSSTTVSLTPTPDLVIDSIDAPTTGISGQNLAVNWTVRNAGIAPTKEMNWYEAFYLSRDQIFDQNTDTYLGYSFFNGNLAAEEIYSKTQSFRLPQGLSGSVYLFAVTDGGNSIYERTGEDNNVVYDINPITLTLPQPADLVVGTMTIPSNGVAGRNATITYTVTNQGANPVQGNWSDSVYISKDNQWDINDAFLGQVQNSDELASGNSYTQTLTAPLPGLVPGDYQVIIRSDIRNQIPESNETNNLKATLDQVNVDLERLTLGIPSTGTLGQNQGVYYRLDVGAGETLRLKLDSASTTAVNELYIRYGETPTRSLFDAGFSEALSSDQEIVIPTTRGGTYYVLAYGSNVQEGTPNYNIEADVLDFSISRLGTSLGSNKGQTTVKISGAKFTVNDVVNLIATDGTQRQASKVWWKDSAELWATFDLQGLNIGNYDVRVSHDTQTATLDDAFIVTNGAIGNLSVSVDAPSALRPGQAGIVTVNYTNTGETDIVAPLLTLVAENANLKLPEQTELVGSSLQFLGINSQGPAGIIPPGASGSLSLLFNPTVDNGSINFSISQASQDQIIDWSNLKDQSKPNNFSDDAWDAIWQNFVTSVGNKAGTYQAVLADNANHLSQLGEYTNDAIRLLGFELQQVSNSLLGSNQGDSIDQRFSTGTFGRGGVNDWDIKAISDSDGDVTLFFGNSPKLFTKQSNGSYQGLSGDNATLTQESGIYRLREEDGSLIAFRLDGKFDYIEDTNQNRITASYTDGKLTRLVHSDSNYLAFSYNAQGLVSQTTDQDNWTTTYEYDTNGEYLLKITTPEGTTSYTYETNSTSGSLHAIKSVRFSDNTGLFYEYDNQERLIKQSLDGNAEPITYSYDSTGGVTITDVSGAASKLLYNDLGTVGRIEDPLKRITQYQYDSDGSLTKLTAADNTVSTFTYDNQGNIISSLNSLGQQIKYSYESTFNQLASLQDQRGNLLNYNYDNQGNLQEITYADGSKDKFSYDATGNLTVAVNRRNQNISYTYNLEGLLTRKDFANGTSATYTYDSRGNLLSAVDSDSSVTYAYDSVDRLTKVSYAANRFLEFTYDSAGRRSRMVDQDGFTTNYNYDTLGKLKSLTDATGANIISYTYDNVGRLSREDNGNGTYTTYSYDLAGQLLNLVNYELDGTVNSRFDYTYDNVGRRTSMTTLEGTTTYGYDSIGQLNLVNLPKGRIIEYQYDAAGNRIKVKDSGVETAYNTNNLNQYTSVGAAIYNYDTDGNLITKTQGGNTWSYSYDSENRLIGAVTPDGNWNYEYDALGNRIASILNGQRTEYLLDPKGLGDVVGEYGGNGNIIARYTHGLGLVSRVDGTNAASYYDADAIGSIVGLTGADGDYLNQYSYLPFGESLSIVEAVSNPFEYVGQWGVMREGNSLDFMRARYYDTLTGKFNSPDPLGIGGGDTNFYRYSINNPNTYIDPSGNLFFVPILVAAAIGAASGAVTDAAIQGVSIAVGLQDEFSWTSVGVSAGIGAVGGGVFGSAAIKAVKAGTKAARLEGQVWSHWFPERWDKALPSFLKNTKFGTHYRRFFNSDRVLGRLNGQFVSKKVHFWTDYYATMGVGYKAAYWGQKFVERWTPLNLLLRTPLWVQKSGLLGAAGGVLYRAITSIIRPSDPNDILGPAGFGEEKWITASSTLPYTIRFENQTTATAPAQTVTVSHPLDADLDWRTFRLGSFGWGGLTFDVPENTAFYNQRLDLTATRGYFVDVTAGIDIVKGEAFWTVITIDPNTGDIPENALVGFLPPNKTDGIDGIGDGFVNYTIKAKRDVPTGTVIDAKATIIFDTEAPIDTPPIFNTLDAGKPISTVNSLAATVSTTEFLVTWTGNDDANGSALANYTIYVSDNGGKFTPWLDKTTLTEATYAGQAGHTYTFYSVATDNSGLTETAPTQADATITVLGIVDVNHPPTIQQSIVDQTATEKTTFNFIIPTNTFTDIDAGDVLTYSATLENGDTLPSWLTFNPTDRTFSGTPTNDNVGSLNVKVTATDKAGATVSDILTITVENTNDAPILNSAIADQNAKQGNAFSFQIPTNTFTDIDAGDVLTYSATLENGNALPSWLTFNSTTRTFSGTPTNDNVGNLNVKAIATDKAGANVSDIFVITVENVNDAPTLANKIADQNAKQGNAFNFQIPSNTFADIDAGDVLTYSATLENGNSLPSWLTFNSTTRTFSGTPTNDNVGNLNIKAIATDKAGATVSDIFTITVENINDAPVLKNPLVDQTVKVNSTFTFTLPKDTFFDPDAVNPYKNLVIFGDSLSDTGNAYKASGNTFPPSPNYQGRLSNGLIWVDYFAPDLQFTNPSIQNYAFLGANTGVSNTFGQITVPGLLTQIQQFKTVNTNSIGKDGLYVIWAGANDFLNLATDPTQAVTNAVTNISSAITTLAGLGAKEIVVGNLTDLGATPLSIANNNVANARAISIGFNAALNQALTNLEPALNVDLSLVDIFSLSTAFQTNPANYKFTNITQPLITVTTPVNPDQYAFWDDVHPTTRLHQLVTDTFETTLLNDGVIPDLIKYSATLADGSNLPDWLNFNSTTRTFSGTPNTGNVGKLDVKVIATDKAGATVNDIFTLAVNQSTTVGTPGDDKLIATPGSQFDGQNNIVFTGAGKDEVDLSTVSAFPNSGNNIVDLGSGEDTIFVNKGDRAFGSDGNDTFDARDGQGGNRISGGVGDDTFYLGSNDRALGGDGKDIFRVSLGGGNLISGGAGADQFWIVNAELPKAANTVLDFQLGTDVIGISGAVSLGITTSTLKLNQVGADTAIVFNNQTLATLTGIQASSLSLTDPKQFVFA
jgi:RHS repeat-associated protein